MLLRELLPTDLDGMYRLDSDPEVHRYLGNRPVHDKKHLAEVIESVRNQYVLYGIGRWAVIEKSTGQFAGWAGLKWIRETTNNHCFYHDLGYRLIRACWGKGYASECASVCVHYGFEHLNLKEIWAAAHIENMASNRVLMKTGFTKLNTFMYDESVHNWYKIERGKLKLPGIPYTFVHPDSDAVG